MSAILIIIYLIRKQHGSRWQQKADFNNRISIAEYIKTVREVIALYNKRNAKTPKGSQAGVYFKEFCRSLIKAPGHSRHRVVYNGVVKTEKADFADGLSTPSNDIFITLFPYHSLK